MDRRRSKGSSPLHSLQHCAVEEVIAAGLGEAGPGELPTRVDEERHLRDQKDLLELPETMRDRRDIPYADLFCDAV